MQDFSCNKPPCFTTLSQQKTPQNTPIQTETDKSCSTSWMVSCTWCETKKWNIKWMFATCYCWIMELIPAKNTCNYVTCVCNLCAKLSGLSEAEYCCSSNLISNLSIFSDIIFILWDQNLKLKFDDVLSGKALIILDTWTTGIKVLSTRPWPTLNEPRQIVGL